MENNQHSGNGQSTATTRGGRGGNGGNSGEITAVIDEVIARVKQILNNFEQVVEEAFTLFEMLRDLIQQVRELFTLRQGARQEEPEYA
jgi:methyl-accepting chemotaxis protein